MQTTQPTEHDVPPQTGNARESSDLNPEDVRARTKELLAERGDGVRDQNLIAILQATQDCFGYLPRESLLAIAAERGIPAARVYGVATFYNQFRFSPPGRHQLKVCMGTACAIKLGNVILESFERRLQIREDEVSPDREYSLERVACVGCCSMAPVAVEGEAVHGNMTPTKVDGILLKHQLERERLAREEAEHADATEEPA